MIEAPRYPFIPGERGFPLEALLQSGWSTPITTESNNRLYMYQAERKIAIHDLGYCYRLMAEVDPNTDILQLNVQTLNPKVSDKRHPDLYASKFVEVAVDYFRSQGIHIKHFLGEWKEGGVNYFQFFENLKKTGDPIPSARQTWTGHVIGRVGFTKIPEDSIVIENKVVYAPFWPAA